MYYKNIMYCNIEKYYNNVIYCSNVIFFLVREENIRMLIRVVLCLCLNSVILLGLLLKVVMLFWIYCSMVRMFIRVWLFWVELCLVFRKFIMCRIKIVL